LLIFIKQVRLYCSSTFNRVVHFKMAAAELVPLVNRVFVVVILQSINVEELLGVGGRTFVDLEFWNTKAIRE